MRLDRRPVAARDRAGQLEAVLDRAAHQRLERLRRRACGLEEERRRALERDDVVRREHGAGVVERARRVGELERPQAEQLGELRPLLDGLGGLAGDRGPGAVELLGPARARERLQRVDAEAALVRGERGERRRAAHVRDPRAGLDAGRDLGDRAVGNAEQHELRLVASPR